MPEQLMYLLYGFGGILTLAMIIGLLKAIDWLISLKYRTKDECVKCQAAIFETIKNDKNLLVEVNTKVTMILKCLIKDEHLK